jgi:hypothetical protein
LRITAVQGSDAGSYACRVTNLFSNAESAAAALTVNPVSLTIVSAFAAASVPPAGLYSYGYGTNVTCTVTGSPVVVWDAQSEVVNVCTGWTGTGSVPAAGAGTNVSFAMTNNCSLTWRWRVWDWAVSNQTVSTVTNYQAHDVVTAGSGFRVAPQGSVTVQAGKAVRLDPEFSVASGGYFRATINTNL